MKWLQLLDLALGRERQKRFLFLWGRRDFGKHRALEEFRCTTKQPGIPPALGNCGSLSTGAQVAAVPLKSEPIPRRDHQSRGQPGASFRLFICRLKAFSTCHVLLLLHSGVRTDPTQTHPWNYSCEYGTLRSAVWQQKCVRQIVLVNGTLEVFTKGCFLLSRMGEGQRNRRGDG